MSSIRVNATNLDSELQSTSESILKECQEAFTSLQGKTCQGSEWTGWFQLPNAEGADLCREIREFHKSLQIDFDSVIVIGIGGSYLGTRAAADLLGDEFSIAKHGDFKPLFYCGHEMSEWSLSQLLKIIEDRNPIVNIISKSGTTTEPGAAFRILRHVLVSKYGEQEANQRIVATTDPKTGALRKLATEKGWKSFSVPPDVGGRYSVHTAVGLVPLELAGYSIEDFVGGAADLFNELDANPTTHPALQYAAIRNAAYRHGKRIEVLTLQGNRYRSLGEWWKQLFGESEGKEHKGLFPASLVLTTDLHSLGQYMQDGERNILETFLTFAEDQVRVNVTVPKVGDNHDQLDYLVGKRISAINEAARQATAMAHREGGVPSIDLLVGEPNARTLGYVIAFFEVACAVSGIVLGVNPFDQPGVESYKKKMFSLLGKPGC